MLIGDSGVMCVMLIGGSGVLIRRVLRAAVV